MIEVFPMSKIILALGKAGRPREIVRYAKAIS
jgi:hypothetical protein